MNTEEEEFNNHLEQQKQHEAWYYWDRDEKWREAQLKQTEETNPWKTG